MKERLILMDMREEGREEGCEEYRNQIIEGLLRKGKFVEEISELCDIPVEYVRKVVEETLTNA